MVFNSLNAIVDDIMLIYRDNNISESESLSKIQVEQWVHDYRAKLIREDLNKGYDLDPEYAQTMEIHLSPITFQDSSYIACNDSTRRSDNEIPSGIPTHNAVGILSVKDLAGNLIQVGDEAKAKYQSTRKYTCGDYIAYKKGKYLFVAGPGNLEYVNMQIILENPTDAEGCFDAEDTKYPVPIHIIPVIKQLIFDHEIRIMSQMPTDNINNSHNDLENITVN